MKKLTKTQKIITLFAAITLLAFCIWGCKSPATTEIKNDSTAVIVDTLKLDTLK